MGQIIPKLRTDAPIDLGVRSNTTTERPRLAAQYACARPRIPAPTIATSAVRASFFDDIRSVLRR